MIYLRLLQSRRLHSKAPFRSNSMLLFKQRGFRDSKIAIIDGGNVACPYSPEAELEGSIQDKQRTFSGAGVLRMWLWRVHGNWIVSSVDVAYAAFFWLPGGKVSSLWCKHNFYCTFRFMYRLPSQWLSCNKSDLLRLCSSFLVLYGRRTNNLAHQLLSCSQSKI